RVLAQGEPPADWLAALQARLEAEEPAPLLLYALRGERARNHRFLESLRNGTVSPMIFAVTGTAPPTAFEAMTNAIGAALDGKKKDPLALIHMPGFLTVQHAVYVRHLNEMVEIAKRPPEEWNRLLAQQQVKV